MADINALFAKLSASYLEAVPDKLLQLRQLIESATHESAAITELAEFAHQLAGSAGTFALPELGEQARVLLDKVRQIQGKGRVFSTDERDEFEALVDTMETTTLLRSC